MEPTAEPTPVPGIPADEPPAGGPVLSAEEPPAGGPVLSAEDHAFGALNPSRLVTQVLTGGVAPLVVYEIGRHAGLADATALA
ncbi:MAG: hypothetical protein KGJ77_10555, partial [Acidobacteriota bacterium]|nr:hypothetical protein [Acidobacteriota bacterium]